METIFIKYDLSNIKVTVFLLKKSFPGEGLPPQITRVCNIPYPPGFLDVFTVLLYIFQKSSRVKSAYFFIVKSNMCFKIC